MTATSVPLNVLALCGSLRKASVNAALRRLPHRANTFRGGAFEGMATGDRKSVV